MTRKLERSRASVASAAEEDEEKTSNFSCFRNLNCLKNLDRWELEKNKASKKRKGEEEIKVGRNGEVCDVFLYVDDFRIFVVFPS